MARRRLVFEEEEESYLLPEIWDMIHKLTWTLKTIETLKKFDAGLKAYDQPIIRTKDMQQDVIANWYTNYKDNGQIIKKRRAYQRLLKITPDWIKELVFKLYSYDIDRDIAMDPYFVHQGV